MTGDLHGSATGAIPRLDSLEIHSGLVQGRRRSPRADLPSIAGSARDVLDALLLKPLSDPPCHVAFSGGRDSSAILAAATRVARANGLADPVPLTARLDQHPRTWETEWQELTIRHLGLGEWNRFSIVHELDALGSVAAEQLRRHGLFWPSQAHSMVVYSRQAGSGSLVTGGGGDEVFTPWRDRPVPMRKIATLRPRRRALKWMAFAALPHRLQIRIAFQLQPVQMGWLRPEVQRRLQRQRLQAAQHRSSKWADALEGLLDGRFLELVRGTLDVFAAESGVHLHEPFYDPRYVRALGAEAPPDGYASRTAALTAQFGDLLPSEVLSRGTKAVFTEVAWGPSARAFAEQWDGSGLDETLVDPQRLKEEWAKPRPSARSLTSLRQAWLVAQGLA